MTVGKVPDKTLDIYPYYIAVYTFFNKIDFAVTCLERADLLALVCDV